MRVSLVLFALSLLPLPSAAQAPGDTVEVVVPPDRDCSDFETRVAAQGWYESMRFISDSTDADPHNLDANGDGEACESIQEIRVMAADSLVSYTTTEQIGTVTCPDTSFSFAAYIEDTRAAFRGDGDHQEWHKMNGCIDLQAILRQP